MSVGEFRFSDTTVRVPLLHAAAFQHYNCMTALQLYDVHSAWPQGLRESDLRVMCEARFDRATDAGCEARIEQVWGARVAANPRLFNGTKFRLHSVECEPLPAIRLGLTDYKSHLGTNMAEDWEQLRDQGTRGEFLASPLGNGAVVCGRSCIPGLTADHTGGDC